MSARRTAHRRRSRRVGRGTWLAVLLVPAGVLLESQRATSTLLTTKRPVTPFLDELATHSLTADTAQPGTLDALEASVGLIRRKSP